MTNIKNTKLSDEYIDKAKLILSSLAHSEQSIKQLARNMQVLRENNLDKINQRLQRSKKPMKILETLAELNFAISLISNNADMQILYEPNEFVKPPDFLVKFKNITYYMEVKRPGKLERDNRKENILKKIKKQAKRIKIPKGFSCFLSDDFKEKHIDDLIKYIGNNVNNKQVQHVFEIDNKELAKIEFFTISNKKFNSLQLYAGGDLSVVNITGQTKRQIKQTMRNAVNKFENNHNEKVINLIILEVKTGGDDIDICEALYGTEVECFERNAWTRKSDGLFDDDAFSSKISGVIVRTRKDQFEIICKEYLNILCLNKKAHKQLTEKIKKILSIDKVFQYNMRPYEGFFDIPV